MAPIARANDRNQVVIEGVKPEIDAGRFAVKRILGEPVVVEADVYADGHEAVACRLRYRKAADKDWREAAMHSLGNDRFRGEFTVTELGRYRYTVMGWIDPFASWRQDLIKRVLPEDIALALLIGAERIAEVARRAKGNDAKRLKQIAATLRSEGNLEQRCALATDPELNRLMERYVDRRLATRYPRELQVVVDRERARFSSWYELFPRSCADTPDRHGTFRDLEARLPYIAEMGFDVLYLPPIHPIGQTKRKGRNNVLTASASDPGSPWAIGSEEGGHKATHPELGTLHDFRRFLDKARGYDIEIALDIAFQCSPDHPYVRDRPQWFRQRLDGTIQYAENPPKRYEDIYGFDFETSECRALFEELKSVVLFWIDTGVRIFRVDNPHTKPFSLWEELITEIKAADPEVLFLSEAFTRPKPMHRLAKLGFTQSYTYFAWRNTKQEITDYFTELTQTDPREYFRPNLWPNTPDILTEFLQFGGRPAFMIRLVLAATLGASYGIYGPPFELLEHTAREPGSEEYLDSEKYAIRHWDLDRPDSLKNFIARINQIRKNHRALQSDWSLRFHAIDNAELIAYSKRSTDGVEIVLVVVNLDPRHTQAGWLQLPLEELAIDPERPYQIHDLLSEAYYLWHGARNYIELNPSIVPAHVFLVRRHVRSEQDFDYFM